MNQKTNSLALAGTLLIAFAVVSYMVIDYSLAVVSAAAGVILFIIGAVQESEK